MKTHNYKKYVLKIISYILLAVGIFINSFINEIDGRHAFFAKGFYAFIFLYIIITSVKVIIKELILIRNKKMEKSSFLVILIAITVSVCSFFLGAINVPAICRDIIEGRYSTTLEISDILKINDSKTGWPDKNYISGITLEGSKITFEVSDSTYIEVIMINHAKLIEIEYWKHSKTLVSWDIGS